MNKNIWSTWEDSILIDYKWALHHVYKTEVVKIEPRSDIEITKDSQYQITKDSQYQITKYSQYQIAKDS